MITWNQALSLFIGYNVERLVQLERLSAGLPGSPFSSQTGLAGKCSRGTKLEKINFWWKVFTLELFAGPGNPAHHIRAATNAARPVDSLSKEKQAL